MDLGQVTMVKLPRICRASGVYDTASTRGVTVRMFFGMHCKSKLEQFKAEQEAAKDEDLDMFGD